ncbi:MAG TPA: TetR family transcriptional regulator [Stellaceae bacterium]|jgi:AcrR family transcriptional regulator|nr:TetR family transcriptional regulator [Stellaceae bacterium]
MAQSRGRRAETANPDRIIDAMAALVEAQGWRRVSLAGIADEAGLPILQVYRLFPSRTAVLCGFLRRVDEAVLAAPLDMEVGEKLRDRLFDLLMRRFDALAPHRAFTVALRRDLPTDPLTAAALAGAGLCSMRLMLDAAGIASHGIAGVVAVKLTAAAYLAAAHTWSRDESPDLAPTMATLDRRLRGIERWLVPLHSTSRNAVEADA